MSIFRVACPGEELLLGCPDPDLHLAVFEATLAAHPYCPLHNSPNSSACPSTSVTPQISALCHARPSCKLTTSLPSLPYSFSSSSCSSNSSSLQITSACIVKDLFLPLPSRSVTSSPVSSGGSSDATPPNQATIAKSTNPTPPPTLQSPLSTLWELEEPWLDLEESVQEGVDPSLQLESDLQVDPTLQLTPDPPAWPGDQGWQAPEPQPVNTGLSGGKGESSSR